MSPYICPGKGAASLKNEFCTGSQKNECTVYTLYREKCQKLIASVNCSTYLSLKNIILHIVHDEIIFSPLKNHSVASINDLRKQMYKFD